MHRLKVEIASQLLSGICREDGSKSAHDREQQLRNALDTATALIQLAAEDGSPGFDHTPPLFTRAKPVQEREIKREPLEDLVRARHQDQSAAPRMGPRPQ